MIDIRVAVKGAGEMGSAVAWCLHKSHLKVFMTDIQKPLAVRREVCFCEAVYSNMENLVLRARSETEGSASGFCD